MFADLYDFDKTIFNGESGTAFLTYCMMHHPTMLKYLPEQLYWTAKHYVLHSITMEQLKEHLYSCVREIDTERLIEDFWDENAHKINNFFINRDRNVPCIVCSASPYWQIAPICKKLGADIIIGTGISPADGKITGLNCSGAQKLEFIKEYAPDYKIRDAYTDNIKSDAPLLSLATRNKFKVTNGILEKI